MNTIKELTEAAKVARYETFGYPSRVARVLGAWLDSDKEPTYVIRNIINDILCELEVNWDREEDAPDWPKDLYE